jgi:hypothetical protein
MQAKGRIERAFQTAQDRLVKGLRQAQLAGVPRPADYELGSPESRAAARALLELAKLNPDQRRTFRVTLQLIGKPMNLETSTCQCQLWQDGTVFELVTVDGADPTEAQQEQLEKFIREVPIDGKEYKVGCRQ